MGNPVQGLELGSIVLTGYVDATKNLVGQGFLVSEDLSALQQNQGNAISVEIGAGQDFQDTLKGLALDKTYYFKAWAEFSDEHVVGNRKVYSETSPFSFAIKLGVNKQTLIKNDTAIVSGFIVGLQNQGISAVRYGFIYSDMSDASLILAEVGNESDTVQLYNLTNVGDFYDTIVGLNFNTTYFFKTWAITSDGNYYESDETGTFRIDDGWKRLSNASPFDLMHGIGGVFENEDAAYMMGCGYLKDGCEPGTPQYLLKCTPNSSNDMMEWAVTNSKISTARFNAVSFIINDVLYIGTGQAKTADGSLYIYDDFRQIQQSAIDVNNFQLVTTPPAFKSRAGAFAFVVNDKVYVGGGIGFDASNNETYLNDCWEFDPATGQWHQMDPLPLMMDPTSLEGVVYDKGRREALAFAFKNHGFGYVGGGVNGLQMLKDFWRFTPPDAQDSTGSWELFSFFHGPGRVDAVSIIIDEIGYFGTGYNFTEGLLNDFWAFNPANPAAPFSKTAPFPGASREDALGFTVNGNGYLGMGVSRKLVGGNWSVEANHDMWRYVPKN